MNNTLRSLIFNPAKVNEKTTGKTKDEDIRSIYFHPVLLSSVLSSQIKEIQKSALAAKNFPILNLTFVFEQKRLKNNSKAKRIMDTVFHFSLQGSMPIQSPKARLYISIFFI